MEKLFLRLSNSSNFIELGPFESAGFSGGLYVNGAFTPCALFDADAGYWTITDGAVLGDPILTGTQAQIIWGQAKVTSSE